MNEGARLESLYDAFAHRVYAYALRHCGPNDADDVLSETFAVAWRRIDVIPEHSLPWLLTTAANLIRNHRRADIRRMNLMASLVSVYDDSGPLVDEAIAERDHVLAALQRLTDLEREALLLVAWDGLQAGEAATVIGCGPRAFRARLSRARARLATELAHPQASGIASVPITKEVPS